MSGWLSQFAYTSENTYRPPVLVHVMLPTVCHIFLVQVTDAAFATAGTAIDAVSTAAPSRTAAFMTTPRMEWTGRHDDAHTTIGRTSRLGPSGCRGNVPDSSYTA